MDYTSCLEEMSKYYEARYHKAQDIGINDNSQYYPAYCEIERRYTALNLAMEMLKILPNELYSKEPRKYYEGFVILILKQITLSEFIMTEEGSREYIPYKLKVKKDDKYVIDAFLSSKKAMEKFLQLDFENAEKHILCEDIKECLYYILQWMIIAREFIFPVIKKGKALVHKI